MGADYYLFIDQQYGPYDRVTLNTYFREGRLTRETLVFHHDETADWTPAAEVPSLQFLFETKASRPRARAEDPKRKQTASIPRPQMPTLKRPIILGAGSKPKPVS